MAYVTLASDLHGYLYSVDHEGQLRRQRLGDGTPGQPGPRGLGEPIGSGWSGVTSLAAARLDGALILFGQTRSGGAVTAQVAESDVDTWIDVVPEPVPASTGWRALRAIRPGDAGNIVGLADDASLWRIPIARVADAPPLRPGTPTLESTGWQDRRSVFVLGGRRFDVTETGALRTQSPGMTEMGGGGTWTDIAPDPGGTKGFFPVGATHVAHIDIEGRMWRRPIAFDATGDPVGLGDAVVVGEGFGKWIHRPCAVEGYCWPHAASPGETVTFHVRTRCIPESVPGPVPYDVEFVRLKVIPPRTRPPYPDELAGGLPAAHYDAERGTYPYDWTRGGVKWSPSFEVEIPANWRSGIYAARCTDAAQESYYVPIIVRPSKRSSPFALLANTCTWNAYNTWGGWSKYVSHDHVSRYTNLPHDTPLAFTRPNPGLAPDLPLHGWGPYADYANSEWTAHAGHLLRAELWVSEWLDSLGSTYAFDTYADTDLHAGPLALVENGKPAYKALILSTHPEYWTSEMYRALKDYQDRGGNIVYLGGNGIFELVTLKDDVMHVYPASPEPTNGNTTQGQRPHYLFRNRGLPERALIGVGCDESNTDAKGDPFTITPEASGLPIVKDVPETPMGLKSLREGYRANGWEVDRRGPDTPAAASATGALIAHVPGDADRGGHMLFYRAASNGLVFSASSLSFGGGLAVDPGLQQLVRNVLDACLAN